MTMMVQLDVGYVTQVRQVTGKSHVFTTVALLEFRPKPFGFRRLYSCKCLRTNWPACPRAS